MEKCYICNEIALNGITSAIIKEQVAHKKCLADYYLQKYIKNSLSIIGEFSTNMANDYIKLKEESEILASILEIPFEGKQVNSLNELIDIRGVN